MIQPLRQSYLGSVGHEGERISARSSSECVGRRPKTKAPAAKTSPMKCRALHPALRTSTAFAQRAIRVSIGRGLRIL
jgi:hypothetical protein